ncbi:hypothetical protein VNO78_18443 [Psophocarpus tetragonolobus]|uniref:Uncharacterized protein n=1 Tax=Psophocarpus tetragonolobus TaxID=3891 RepID=A0AAN9SIU0_PSOTE
MQNKKTLPRFAIDRSKLALEEMIIMERCKQEVGSTALFTNDSSPNSSSQTSHPQNNFQSCRGGMKSNTTTPTKIATKIVVVMAIGPVAVARLMVDVVAIVEGFILAVVDNKYNNNGFNLFSRCRCKHLGPFLLVYIYST